MPENGVDSPKKISHSQLLVVDEDFDEKEKIRNREAMEVLFAKLFASISAIKAAYAQLQMAQTPYDPDCIQSADEIVVSELKNLSQLKNCYFKKQIFPSQDEQMQQEIREQQNLLKTYELMVKKLQSQLQLKDREFLSMKEKLQEVEKQNKSLEKKLDPEFGNGSLLALENLHFSGLNPTHFMKLHHFAIKSVKSFVKLMIDEMERARWDLDAAASSIEPDSAHAKPAQKILVFESYVCRNMFADFHDSHFSIPSRSSNSSSKEKKHFFTSFKEMKSRKATELLAENPESRFGKFCRLKYLQLVHPKMETSFFGNLSQRTLVNSGGFPDSAFFSSFSEMARRVWLLHCLAFSFDPAASIFQVRKGCRFSAVYMDAAQTGHVWPDARPTVSFTVSPGFRIGKTLVPCQVVLSPS